MIIPGVMHEMEEEMLRSFHSVSLLLSSSPPPSLPFLSRSARMDASACVSVRVFNQSHQYVCMLAWPRQTLSYKPTVAQGTYAHTLANKMQVGKWGREVGGDEAVG